MNTGLFQSVIISREGLILTLSILPCPQGSIFWSTPCSKIDAERLSVLRLRRWSFFHNDGMVMFFFQGTIAIDGFSMVLSSLDHHHWMFFCRSTIEIDGFSMVFTNSGAMVSDGFDLEKDLRMRIIVTDRILRELCVVFRIQITLLLVNFRC